MQLKPAQPSTLEAIGQTPAVYLGRIVRPGAAHVVVKLESLNPTGSHKDRVARALVEDAERRGAIQPGMTLVDYTGGSTGAALAAVCALKGYGCTVVCSDAYSPEKLRSMRVLGAQVIVLPSHGGRIDQALIGQMMDRARALGSQPGCHYLDMHHSRVPVVAGRAIGEELLAQVPAGIDAFCAGFGTGALLMGVATAFREAGTHTRIVALEPASSPVLSAGGSGTHTIEGLGYGFVPALLDAELYDEVMTVEEEDARGMARRLACAEGILVGTSSGFNVAGAIQLAERLGSGHVVATVCCDSGLKYLSGPLYGDGSEV